MARQRALKRQRTELKRRLNSPRVRLRSFCTKSFQCLGLPSLSARLGLPWAVRDISRRVCASIGMFPISSVLESYGVWSIWISASFTTHIIPVELEMERDSGRSEHGLGPREDSMISLKHCRLCGILGSSEARNQQDAMCVQCQRYSIPIWSHLPFHHHCQ